MGERQKKILIVDDDEGLQFVIAKRLHSRGFACHQALTVEEGLRLVAAVEPDLVLLDLGFVGNDGTDFLQAMRYWLPLGEAPPPVLVMSCYAESDIVDYVMAQGACGFLAKPYNHQEFIDRVNRHLAEGNSEQTS